MVSDSLIERIEAGTREEQLVLLWEARYALHGAAMPETNWTPQQEREFDLLLTIGTDEACTAAAMMLEPEGAYLRLANRGIDREAHLGFGSKRVGVTGHNPTLYALALASACLKAQGAEG